MPTKKETAAFLRSSAKRQASSAIGWIQLKKFNELASAYSLTAHEIGILQTRLGTIDSDERFSAFVNEAERAFSREHTQWVARQIENAP